MKLKKIWWLVLLVMTLLALVWAAHPYGCYTPGPHCQPGGGGPGGGPGGGVSLPGESPSLQSVQRLSDRGHKPAQAIRAGLKELYGK